MKNKKKNPLKPLEKKLWKCVSDFIRKRDGINNTTSGYCCTCGDYCEGSKSHAGHYLPSRSCKLLSRYHPDNIHLQCFKCNVPTNRSYGEKVKVLYAKFMYSLLGTKKVNKLIDISTMDIKPTEEFYTKLTELYKCGNTKKIIDFIESFV